MKKIYRSITLPIIIAFAMTQMITSGVQAQTFPVDTLLYNGNPNKFINIVFLGDGFQNAQLATFKTKAQDMMNYLFTTAPFQEYKNYFNVFAIKTPSAQSGANHPQTATDTVPDTFEPLAVVNNYFKSTFDYSQIHRLLVPNYDSVNAVAVANFPLFKQNIILVNSNFYGGSGGAYATSSLEAQAAEIVVHEIGHSYAQLADEYYAGDGFVSEKANQTQQTDTALVKWKNWLGVQGIGIYRHDSVSPISVTWYKPHNNCKMQFLGITRPFCAVCKETIVEKTHDNFGNVITSKFPLADTSIYALTPFKFKVTTVKPNPNTLRVKWKLNGNVIQQTTVDSLPIDSSQLAFGYNTLVAEVLDTTAFTRANAHPGAHAYTKTWVIKRQPGFNQYTVTNNTGQSASDLHMTFTGTGGTLYTVVVSQPSIGTATASIPSNGTVTNTATIVWPGNFIQNGQSVTVYVASDFGAPQFNSGYWTRNNVPSGNINPGDIALVQPNGIPTLSQWGMIIFALMMLTVTLIFVYRKRQTVAV